VRGRVGSVPCYARGVRTLLQVLAVAVSAALAVNAAGCSGRVTTPATDAGATDDAATDDTLEEDDAEPEDAARDTITPPACPDYRPVKGVPCRAGLSCFFPCSAGYDYAIRATCPTGKWVIENTAACEISSPDVGGD